MSAELRLEEAATIMEALRALVAPALEGCIKTSA